jgi:hypothetical protein
MGWNKGVGWLDWHPVLAPDPDELVGEVRAQHFHAITHEYPVLHRESPLYAEAEAKGFLLDHAYPDTAVEKLTSVTYMTGQRFIDFSHPAAREWWWAAHRDLVGAGIAVGGRWRRRPACRYFVARRYWRDAAQPLRPVALSGVRGRRGADRGDGRPFRCVVWRT